MDRKSRNFVIAGASVASLGTGLFIVTAAVSEGPTPFLNGLLMWVSWGAGLALASRGLKGAGIDLFGESGENRHSSS